jgi:hypothetical protein
VYGEAFSQRLRKTMLGHRPGRSGSWRLVCCAGHGRRCCSLLRGSFVLSAPKWLGPVRGHGPVPRVAWPGHSASGREPSFLAWRFRRRRDAGGPRLGLLGGRPVWTLRTLEASSLGFWSVIMEHFRRTAV